MSISVPRITNVDWRALAAQNAAVDRRYSIKNLQRNDFENAPQWKAKQQNLYGNLVDVTPDSSISNVIIQENSLASNAGNNLAIVTRDLRTIADPQVVQYILDRLSPDEILYLTVNFKSILREFKKNGTRMDKDIFVEYVKTNTLNNGILFNPPSALTPEAQARADAVQDENDRRNQRIEADRARVEQRRALQNSAASAAGRAADLEQRREEYGVDFVDPFPNLEPLRQRRELQVRRGKERFQQELLGYFGEAEDLREQALIREARERQDEKEQEMAEMTRNAPPIHLGDEDIPSTPIKSANGGGGSNKTISPQDKTPGKNSSGGSGKKQRKRKPRRKQEQINLETSEGFQGKGLIFGRGKAIRPQTAQKRFYFGRYYLELDKLANNILSAKYATTDGFLPTLKVQHISNKVKELIEDVMKDHYDERIFRTLSEDDKRVFKRFARALKLDLPIQDDLDDKFQKDFEITLGEWNSGNDAPEIKKKLRYYVVEGLNEGKLNRNQAYFLLYQLSL